MRPTRLSSGVDQDRPHYTIRSYRELSSVFLSWMVMLAGGADMTSLTIISALLGMWLGLTFRVFVLVPAAILALATLAGSGAASEAGALWMIALDICVIAAMQTGYIGGSVLFMAVAD